MSELIYVQFSDETETVIIGSALAPQPEESWPFQGAVQDDDQRYIAFINRMNPNESQIQRDIRDGLLRDNYDRGILMAMRALRLASTAPDKAYANSKIAELDAYAELLLAVPSQPGFPLTIVWPAVPTK